MKSRICPCRQHCRDSGNCEFCYFEKAFAKLSDKNKKLSIKNKTLQEEIQNLKDKLEILTNPNF